MNPHVEVEIARRYLVDNHQSFSQMPGNTWSLKKDQRIKKITGVACTPEHWHTLPTRILAASPHIQGYDVPGEEIDRLKSEGLTLLEALERLGM